MAAAVISKLSLQSLRLYKKWTLKGLWSAALNGDDERVCDLILEGRDVNELDSSGYAALHYAARNGHMTCCNLLLREGRGNVNIRTRSGQATALHRAAYCGHDNVVRLLLNYGANVRLADSDGQTPLHKAAERHHTNAAKMIFAKDPELRTYRDKRNRLSKDMAPDNFELSQLLT